MQWRGPCPDLTEQSRLTLGFLDSFLVLASADDRTGGRALSEIRSDDDNGFLRRTGTTGRLWNVTDINFFLSFGGCCPNKLRRVLSTRGETPWLLCAAQGATPARLDRSPPRGAPAYGLGGLCSSTDKPSDCANVLCARGAAHSSPPPPS